MTSSLIPSEMIGRLATLPDFLRSNILGQDEVLHDISGLLRRSFCELRFPQRPIASMLYLGPTGVGKTETALLFTEHLYGDKDKLQRLDMSEYMVEDSIKVLRGASIHERGILGMLYDRSGGSGTLLFDEIEKAHREILDVFLQILSAGRFTLANGETLDLRNYVIVATSNIGSRMLMESRTTDRETLVTRTEQAGAQEMRVETFGRFDLRCVFNKLGYETLKAIGQLHTDKCLGIINGKGHALSYAPGVVEYIQEKGYSEHFGARPMLNAAMCVLGDPVAEQMLINGGRPVRGIIKHDRRSKKCSLEVAAV
jgi:ATP-dependent Clp protease ATP-binding subunit ClpA